MTRTVPYREVVQLLESVNDDFHLLALYSLSIIRLSKLDKARLNTKFGTHINKLLDMEGRLPYRVGPQEPRPHQEQALDIAWKHLRANKLFGFFFLFTCAQAVCVGTKYRQTLAYRECRARYNQMLLELGLPMYVEPEDIAQSST